MALWIKRIGYCLSSYVLFLFVKSNYYDSSDMGLYNRDFFSCLFLYVLTMLELGLIFVI